MAQLHVVCYLLFCIELLMDICKLMDCAPCRIVELSHLAFVSVYKLREISRLVYVKLPYFLGLFIRLGIADFYNVLHLISCPWFELWSDVMSSQLKKYTREAVEKQPHKPCNDGCSDNSLISRTCHNTQSYRTSGCAFLKNNHIVSGQLDAIDNRQICPSELCCTSSSSNVQRVSEHSAGIMLKNNIIGAGSLGCLTAEKYYGYSVAAELISAFRCVLLSNIGKEHTIPTLSKMNSKSSTIIPSAFNKITNTLKECQLNRWLFDAQYSRFQILYIYPLWRCSIPEQQQQQLVGPEELNHLGGETEASGEAVHSEGSAAATINFMIEETSQSQRHDSGSHSVESEHNNIVLSKELSGKVHPELMKDFGMQEAQPSQPKYRNFESLESRNASFQQSNRRWRLSPHRMCQAGFFCTKSRADVQCFSCGLVIKSFTKEADPWLEHARHRPECEFVLRERGRDFVDSLPQKTAQQALQDQINPKSVPSQEKLPVRTSDERALGIRPSALEPRYRDESKRMKTYSSNQADREQLAAAGFYLDTHDGHPKCYYCGLEVQEWNHGDDPWKKHARGNPGCTFVLYKKGQPFIDTEMEFILRANTGNETPTDSQESEENFYLAGHL